MSLINQMLKDIEKRSSSQEAQNGVAPPGTVPTASRRRRPKWWAGASVMLLVLAAFVWWRGFERTESTVASIETAKTVASPPAAQIVSSGTKNQVPAIEEAPPVSIDNLRIDEHDHRLQIEVSFSRTPVYRLAVAEQGKQLVVELPVKTRLSAALPDTSALALVRSVVSEKDGQGTRLVFSFNQACQYRELTLDASPGGEGRLLSFNVQPEPLAVAAIVPEPRPGTDAEKSVRTEVSTDEVPSSPLAVADHQANVAPIPAHEPEASEMTRQKLPVTPRERAARYYREGFSALRQGNPRAAETDLRAALAIEPQHTDARDLLLRLLAQQGRDAERKALLAEAVRDVPQHLPYRLAYARLLIESGALTEAREILVGKPRPPVVEAQGLYAMLATVCQRLGRYDEAVQTYRQLLAVKPGKATWWLGLGIALEGALLKDQARQAYGQALARGGLSSGVQTYIRQRLRALENEQFRQPAAGVNAGKETT
ncbi:MAG: biosis protein MshN [Desulfuromonadales bacterium]|nr:biosis protein MshN [Desulfuromonadales bacterium]